MKLNVSDIGFDFIDKNGMAILDDFKSDILEEVYNTEWWVQGEEDLVPLIEEKIGYKVESITYGIDISSLKTREDWDKLMPTINKD